MSKVWVVNYSGHNIHKAEKYGEIEVLTRDKVNVFQSDRMIYNLVTKMKGIEKDDYILISGTPILNVFVIIIALTMCKKINYLLYNAKDSDYSVRTVIAADIIKIIKEVKNGIRE
ncbi:hypothetical protein CMI37_39020 [Candidatus Pacearchaeota archaeon]|nr:hypothetical protein [Candidatus Pacearchaeota archaeon]